MSDMPETENVKVLAVDNGALLAAFASSDGDCVNQHFGSARGFYVYAVSAEEVRPLAHKLFAKEKKDGNEDKLKPKLAWLQGSDLVYVGSIGGSATKQLVMLGATPVVVKGGPEIAEIIESLQLELRSELSPLLERVIRQKTGRDDGRFDSMEYEGWCEED